MAGVEDPFESEEFKDYAERVRNDLIPKIKDSAVTIALISGSKPDVKQAVELGFMVLLDKPIIAVVVPGSTVPRNLIKVADAIIEGDLDSQNTAERISTAMQEVMAQRAADDIGSGNA